MDWRFPSKDCLSILFASNTEHEPSVSTTHTADAENATRELERADQRCMQRGQVTRTEPKKKEKPREENDERNHKAISPTSDMNLNRMQVRNMHKIL